MMHDSIADAPWQPSAPYAGQPLHCGNRWVCICVCICICISIVFVFVFVYIFVFVSYAGQPLHCGDRWQIINPLPKKSGIFISLEAQIRSIYVLYIFGSARIIFTPRNGETAKNSVSQSFRHRHNCLSCRVSLMVFFYEFSTYERLSNSICSTFHPFPAQSSAQWEGELPLYSFPRSSITSQMLSECCLPRFIVIAFFSSSLS